MTTFIPNLPPEKNNEPPGTHVENQAVFLTLRKRLIRILDEAAHYPTQEEFLLALQKVAGGHTDGIKIEFLIKSSDGEYFDLLKPRPSSAVLIEQNMTRGVENHKSVINSVKGYTFKLPNHHEGLIVVKNIPLDRQKSVDREIHERLKAFETSLNSIHNYNKDRLTGANNRLYLEHYRKEYDTDPTKVKIALIMADGDNFKSVNDTYGHAVGDEALKHYIEIFHRHFRPTDVIRLAGDEFVLKMEFDIGMTMEKCEALLKKRMDEVIKELMTTPYELRAAGKTVPLKLGVTWGATISDPQNPQSFDQLFKEADRHMQAKKSCKGKEYRTKKAIKEKLEILNPRELIFTVCTSVKLLIKGLVKDKN